MDGLTLPIIISAALIDSINPSVFGVLVMFLGLMREASENRKKTLARGLWFVLVAYLVYLGIGFGILKFLETIPLGFSSAFYWLAAIWVILAGLSETKGYFWRKKGSSLQMIPGEKERIKIYISRFQLIQKKYPKKMLLATGLLGVFVAIVEFIRAGVLYFAALNLLQQSDYAETLLYLLLYNLIVVIPLFVIVGAIYFSSSSNLAKVWGKKYRGVIRLIMGTFLITLGAYMIYSVSII